MSTINRFKSPEDYRKQIQKSCSEAKKVILTPDRVNFLKRNENGEVLGLDLNGSPIKVSDALVRKLESEFETEKTKSFYDQIAQGDFESMSKAELISAILQIKDASKGELEKALTNKKKVEELRHSSKNFFELDPSKPAEFVNQLSKILNPEEVPDYLMMIVFQTWADITNSPKIPVIDFYIDIIS
jgi:hypothetical protein